MNISKQILLALVLASALFAGGYWTGKGQREVITETKVVQGETKTIVVEHTVTVTRTVKPDGTVTETTKTSDKNKDIKDSEISTDSKSSSRSLASTWGVGGGALVPLAGDLNKRDYYGTVSRRVIGGAWLELMVVPESKQAGLGVRLEF